MISSTVFRVIFKSNLKFFLILCSMGLVFKSNAQFVAPSSYPQIFFPFPTYTYPTAKLMLLEGDLKYLINRTISVNVEFDSTLRFVKEEKAYSEIDFINKFGKELNSKEKGKGKGDKWISEWYDAKLTAHRDRFIQSFNEHEQVNAIMALKDSGDIHLNINIKRIIAPEYSLMNTKPLELFLDCVFTDKNGKVICHYEVSNCQGKGAKVFYYIQGVSNSMKTLANELVLRIYPEY